MHYHLYECSPSSLLGESLPFFLFFMISSDETQVESLKAIIERKREGREEKSEKEDLPKMRGSGRGHEEGIGEGRNYKLHEEWTLSRAILGTIELSFWVQQPSCCSKVFKKQTNLEVWSGLTENIHLLMLPLELCGLCVTQLKEPWSLTV